MPRTPSKQRFAPALLAWYDRARRALPWRLTPDPYWTLVSELMLQQTVMATVLPYFDRFVARFPSFAALAAADESEVLAAWSGLGYYRRARHLHAAARAVVRDLGGALPVTSEAALRALPGLGEYTAAVIAAIHGGQRTFALDGNAARVIARVFARHEPIDEPRARRTLRSLGQTLVPADRPGDFAQAVMELGSRVCTPTSPKCDACPVARFCDAHARGEAAVLPKRNPRREKRVIRLACVAVAKTGGEAAPSLLLVRRPSGSLLADTWSLPFIERGHDETLEAASARALAGTGLRLAGEVHLAGSVRHVFTHRDATADVVIADARGRLADGDGARWATRADDDVLALSSFARKLLAIARDGSDARSATTRKRDNPRRASGEG